MKYPSAVWRPLPENESAELIHPTQAIFHSAVDAPGPTSLFPYFARHDVTLETHLFFKLNGNAEQYMDTNRRADANNLANHTAISIETEDEGNPDEIPWTDDQILRIKDFILWAHAKHAIPLRVCRNWQDPGFGYHSMWGAPSPWTTVRGKTCPGVVRIEQWNRVIVPYIEFQAAWWAKGEIPEMIMVKNERGAHLLVSGGATFLIDNTNDAADFTAAGVKTVLVKDSQFARFEMARVDVE